FRCDDWLQSRSMLTDDVRGDVLPRNRILGDHSHAGFDVSEIVIAGALAEGVVEGIRQSIGGGPDLEVEGTVRCDEIHGSLGIIGVSLDVVGELNSVEAAFPILDDSAILFYCHLDETPSNGGINSTRNT